MTEQVFKTRIAHIVFYLSKGVAKHILRVAVLFLLCSFSQPLAAQSEQDNSVTRQIWLDYNLSYPIAERIDFYFATGYKTIFPNSWHKIFINPEVSYKVPRLILKKLNYDEKLYFGIDIYDAFFRGSANVFEFTPYQIYRLSYPNSKRLVISHYFQLRERFQWETNNWTFDFGLQTSYEARVTYYFQGDLLKFGKGFYMPVSIKFWWNLVDASFHNDVARLTPGIGYQISPVWKTAFLLGYTYTKNTVGGDFNTSNIIFRFRVYHNLGKKE
jgi:hypothetical protein